MVWEMKSTPIEVKVGPPLKKLSGSVHAEHVRLNQHYGHMKMSSRQGRPEMTSLFDAKLYEHERSVMIFKKLTVVGDLKIITRVRKEHLSKVLIFQHAILNAK